MLIHRECERYCIKTWKHIEFTRSSEELELHKGRIPRASLVARRVIAADNGSISDPLGQTKRLNLGMHFSFSKLRVRTSDCPTIR